LGNPVRYDGQDKRHNLVLETLSELVDWLGICPEMDAGLGVPRPPVELVHTGNGIKVLGRDNRSLDVSKDLHSAAVRLEALVHSEKYAGALCGFIWQSRSPSCGLGSTPLKNPAGEVIAHRSGVVAGFLANEFPWLPMREDTQLTSVEACMDFYAEIEWVQRWRKCLDREALWTEEKLFLKWPAAAKREIEHLLDTGLNAFLARFLHYWRLHSLPNRNTSTQAVDAILRGFYSSK
ncbi:MAG TPA: DUF523 domain-containing protein, partial [Pseudomonadales bacterium]|nr:DUF523 domain-containing protein [Pseudomonadales bacterium]